MPWSWRGNLDTPPIPSNILVKILGRHLHTFFPTVNIQPAPTYVLASLARRSGAAMGGIARPGTGGGLDDAAFELGTAYACAVMAHIVHADVPRNGNHARKW